MQYTGDFERDARGGEVSISFPLPYPADALATLATSYRPGVPLLEDNPGLGPEARVTLDGADRAISVVLRVFTPNIPPKTINMRKAEALFKTAADHLEEWGEDVGVCIFGFPAEYPATLVMMFMVGDGRGGLATMLDDGSVFVPTATQDIASMPMHRHDH